MSLDSKLKILANVKLYTHMACQPNIIYYTLYDIALQNKKPMGIAPRAATSSTSSDNGQEPKQTASRERPPSDESSDFPKYLGQVGIIMLI